MALVFSCPKCSKKLKFSGPVAGSICRCPKCKAQFRVGKSAAKSGMTPGMYRATLLGDHGDRVDLEQNGRDETAKLECPECGSPDVRRLQVIYEMGTTHIESVGHGTMTGIGIGSGFGETEFLIGATSRTTHGKGQTAAASAAAPPARRELGLPIVMLLLGVGGLVGSALLALLWSAIVGLILVVIGATLIVESTKWNSEEWPKLYDEWFHSYRCLRCGNVFTDSELE